MINIEMIDVDKLNVLENNPRTINKEDFKNLCKSISKNQDYFSVRPVLVNKNMQIFAGNMRYQAAKTLGMKQVPVAVMDVDEKRQEELCLRDNIQNGQWDMDKLVNWDEDLIRSVGLKDKQLDDFYNSKIALQDDKIDVVPTADNDLLTVETGDIYQLGKHKIICGDSTDINVIKKLIGNNIIEIALTDPPYNLGYEYHSYKDNKTEQEYKQFCAKWFANLKTVTDKILITCGPQNLGMWFDIEKPRWILNWIKRQAQSGSALLGFNRHEPVVFYNLSEPVVFYGNVKKRVNVDIYDADNERSDVYDVHTAFSEDHEEKKLHSCPKPVKLFAKIMKDFTNTGDVILDVFGGYGTSLLAAEKINRCSYCVELDPLYVALAIRRWEQYTNKKAVKLNGPTEPRRRKNSRKQKAEVSG